MARRGAVAWFTGLALVVACSESFPDPPPCAPIPSQATDVPAGDVVWGFADLHAHPAVELAFNHRLVWGEAIDDAPVNGAELPRIAPCPVETHNHNANSPVDRTVGGMVFPNLARLGGFAHGPVGSASGFRVIDAWPNARDVLHQQMNVASIRRAYEGGLRLMFASTTDDQSIAALLAGPNFVNGFVPDAAADYESAKRQLGLIEDIVERNANWMAIARTPGDARAIIRSGRVALVLSLEMNGLRKDDVERLVRDFGVAHIIPIHLVDNDVGGTAANGDLFNVASAAESAIYRPDKQPMQYMDVIASADYVPTLGWPIEIGTLSPAPVYVGLRDLPYGWYASLCYEPLSACNNNKPETATSFIQFGQQNLRGLCPSKDDCDHHRYPGEERIRDLMGLHLIVDLSHMSARAASQTIRPTTSFARSDYPLIASHGDVAHLCEGNPTQPPCVDETRRPVSERHIRAEDARTIVRDHHGVLGLGTGVGNYDARTVIVARGGPLLTLTRRGAQAAACVALRGTDGPTAGDCEPVPDVEPSNPATSIDSLHIQTVGGISGSGPNAYPFVRIELRDPRPIDHYQRNVVMAPLECSTQACDAVVDIGAKNPPIVPALACSALQCDNQTPCSGPAYSIDDIERVTLEWLYLGCDGDCQKQWGSEVTERQCKSTWDDPRAPHWTIDRVDVAAGLAGQSEAPIVHLDPGSAVPFATLGGKRGSIAVYQRDDRASVAKDVPATGHLLRVSLRSAPAADSMALAGAGPSRTGANVCVALRHWTHGTCEGAVRPSPSAVECPAAEGWWKLNQRGEWAPDVTLYTLVRFPGDESTICGVDVAVLDWEDGTIPALPVDEIRVEAIDDPVGHWVRRYAAISRHVADGRLGTVAFGTDFNGLNGMMDISEFPMPPDALSASACTQSLLPLAPMRFRNQDGTLGGEVLIEERGLATYGLLADLVAAIGKYPGCGNDVHDSLMLSAEAALRTWEATLDPDSKPPSLPQRPFACGPVPGVGH